MDYLALCKLGVPSRLVSERLKRGLPSLVLGRGPLAPTLPPTSSVTVTHCSHSFSPQQKSFSVPRNNNCSNWNSLLRTPLHLNLNLAALTSVLTSLRPTTQLQLFLHHHHCRHHRSLPPLDDTCYLLPLPALRCAVWVNSTDGIQAPQVPIVRHTPPALSFFAALSACRRRQHTPPSYPLDHQPSSHFHITSLGHLHSRRVLSRSQHH